VHNCRLSSSCIELATYVRKKGSVFGNHYHLGTDPSKDPEKFILLQGAVRLEATDIGAPNRDDLDERILAVSEIIIHPYIHHRFTALTDVLFMEPRTTFFAKGKEDNHTSHATYFDGRE